MRLRGGDGGEIRGGSSDRWRCFVLFFIMMSSRFVVG
jgi:hypothetical protein